MTRPLIISFIIAFLSIPSLASDFRSFNPIPSPNIKLPEGARPVTNPVPVDTRMVEKMVGDIIGSWNTSGLDNKLAGDFYNKSRLIDALAVNAPRDAKMRLLSIQGVQTLNQYVMTDPNDNSRVTVSIVSVTARTQAEYNDPTRGLRAVEGTNEYIIRVRAKSNGGKE